MTFTILIILALTIAFVLAILALGAGRVSHHADTEEDKLIRERRHQLLATSAIESAPTVDRAVQPV